MWISRVRLHQIVTNSNSKRKFFMFLNINPTNKNTLHYSWLQQMESKSLNLLIEEEEEKEVEIVHDDYDDPVLASTPSSGTNAVFPERSTTRSRRTFG